MWFAWDTAAFRAIHLGLHHPALDPVMYFLTSPGALKIPLLAAVGIAFLARRSRGIVGLVVLAATLAVSDQTSAKVLKPIFKRARPSVVLADSKPLFGVRRSYSFPSVHAANFFAAAPVVGAVFPPFRVAAFVVAGAVSFSRVYVGDHWPSDVVGGAALGLFLGWLGRRALLRLERTLSAARGLGGAGPSGGP
jgi:undecaprenyl-diphosphatase